MQNSLPDQTDLQACRALMRGGSRTFFAASLLLPRRVYEPATALYAFCRLADDAIDEGDDKVAALAQLRHRLDQAYAGAPYPIAADRAFAAAVTAHDIPRELPLALLEGFEWDAQGRRYQDFASLQDYAARVAGTVGAMMAVLMGTRHPQALARATDLGVAMQLTNIARDVGEDARAGRLYLPLDWLRQENIDPEAWLARPVMSPEMARIVKRLLCQADFLYMRAKNGIPYLPTACRPGIRAAGLIYAGIGLDAARHGYDTLNRRAHVATWRKLGLVLRSLPASIPAPRAWPVPPLAANRYLVEAAARPVHRAGFFMRLEAKIEWMFDLFTRLQNPEARTP